MQNKTVAPTPEEGEYYFDLPKDSYLRTFETCSVGVKKMAKTADGKGLKPGKVEVRVYGYTDEPEKVYEVARAVIVDLKTGMPLVKKTIRLAHSYDSLHP
jgi:hypothetical protein